MESFENKLLKLENTLNNIRGIFEKNQVEVKLKEIEKTLQKRKFLER